MSTVTIAASSASSGLWLRWKPMVRVTWIQYRAALIGLLALFAALAVAMVVGLIGAHDSYARYVADRCLTGHPEASCTVQVKGLPYDSVGLTAFIIALNALPVLFGVFVGAPLVARESESGTYRFAWTQGAGRRRWLVSRVVVLAGVTVASTCLLGLLGSWAVSPFDSLGEFSHWQAGQLGISPITLPAWTLFGLALGMLIGALTRRTVAAMAVSAGVLGGLAVATYLRLDSWLLRLVPLTARSLPNVLPGTGAINGFGIYGASPGTGSWIISGWYTGTGGHPLGTYAAGEMVDRMVNGAIGSGKNLNIPQWLSSHHLAYMVSYQPASRLWMFQGVEALILCGAALLCVFGTLRLVRRQG